MSLILCDECGDSISSIARSCPRCGYPIARKRLQASVVASSKRLWYGPDKADDPGTVQPLKDCYLIDPSIVDAIMENKKPARAPFSLTRINGIGLRVGTLTPIARVGGALIGVSPVYFTFLFVPIFSIGWRVIESSPAGYRFLGKIDKGTCKSLLGSNIAKQALAEEFKTIILGAVAGTIAIGGILLLLALLKQAVR